MLLIIEHRVLACRIIFKIHPRTDFRPLAPPTFLPGKKLLCSWARWPGRSCETGIAARVVTVPSAGGSRLQNDGRPETTWLSRGLVRGSGPLHLVLQVVPCARALKQVGTEIQPKLQ